MKEWKDFFKRNEKTMPDKITVLDTDVTLLKIEEKDFIFLTDMLKAKDGDFCMSDWLRSRNTVEFLGVWEQIHNPTFNYGEFAVIKSQAGLNSLHTTELGAKRVRRNLSLDTDDVVALCRNAVEYAVIIFGQGKNRYVYPKRRSHHHKCAKRQP
jgi:hypothetical protein